MNFDQIKEKFEKLGCEVIKFRLRKLVKILKKISVKKYYKKCLVQIIR